MWVWWTSGPGCGGVASAPVDTCVCALACMAELSMHTWFNLSDLSGGPAFRGQAGVLHSAIWLALGFVEVWWRAVAKSGWWSCGRPHACMQTAMFRPLPGHQGSTCACSTHDVSCSQWCGLPPAVDCMPFGCAWTLLHLPQVGHVPPSQTSPYLGHHTSNCSACWFCWCPTPRQLP